MAELLQEYELSVWEDISSTDTGLGSFIEKKIAVIGSHNLHTPTKAYNVSLKENINGEKTLTFSLPRAYRDKDGELKDNPFLSLLTAERKLKLREGAEYDYFTGENGTFNAEELTNEDTDERWSDYIIKTVDEDKESFVNNYTCKEVYVNELGKNGWSVVLDSELENNYGNLTELATKVLEGSDWKVADDSYNPSERISEPLFVAEITNSDTTDKYIDVTQLPALDAEQIILKPGQKTYVYTFYSQLESNDGIWKIKSGLKDAQILWNGGKFFTDAQLDENRTIIVPDKDEDSYNYYVGGAATKEWVFTPTGGTGNIQKSAIQGGRVVQSIRSHYEPVAKKYVEDYTRNGKPYYHYLETKMVTSEMVANIVTNANGFVTLLGWEQMDGSPIDSEQASLVTADSENGLANFMQLKHSATICNQGFSANKLSVVAGKEYILRIKMRVLNDKKAWSNPSGQDIVYLQPAIAYATGNGYTRLSNVYPGDEPGAIVGDGTFKFDTQGYLVKANARPVVQYQMENGKPNYNLPIWYVDEEGYLCIKLILGDEDLIRQSYGREILLILSDLSYGDLYPYIEDIQLFDFIKTRVDEGTENARNVPIYPTDVPVATTVETHHFYEVKLIDGKSTVAEVSSNPSLYTPVYNDNCQSIRHIDVKESNYFNNINSLAELFGVWAKFKIKHQKNGALFLENGEPVKIVRFTRFSSENNEINWSGFRYGINLKSIKRNVESNAIASKVIVKDNNNEFAPSGMGSIRRASDNPTGENILYNFDYYVAHGLLDQATVLNDLYGTASNHFGYYPQLKQMNDLILPLNEQLAAYEGSYKNTIAMLDYAETSLQQTQQAVNQAQDSLAASKEIWKDNNNQFVVAAQNALNLVTAQRNQYRKDKEVYEEKKAEYERLIYGEEWVPLALGEGRYVAGAVRYCLEDNEQIWYRCVGTTDVADDTPPVNSDKWKKIEGGPSEWNTYYFKRLPVSVQVEFIKKAKRELDLKFYKKYHRFIQEATWTDEKYMDDNLYYYDAVKVSAQNAWPKTKYTITTIDVSGVEKFAAYKFKIGQKSLIEDTEFFGYDYVSIGNTSVKTPKRKEVVVSERTRNFDDPSKSTITIQTYKNQFEELFSKLTATTQSLQYASGEYQRAANTVEADGSIAIESLEQAFAKNAFVLANTSNQLVSWDSGRGIEVADAKNPLQMVRVTSGGIMLTSDAGRTWSTGITASGINTSLLTAGTITADKIRIVTSNDTSAAFAWDVRGINAYQGGQWYNDDTRYENRFVRFDQYGIYGTRLGLTLDEELATAKTFDEAIAKIRANSTFSLTWEGLLLNYQNGATSVSSVGGLEIFHGEQGNAWKFPQNYIENYAPWKPDGESQYTTSDSIPVVSVGRYYTSAAESGIQGSDKGLCYGIRLRNKEGYITLDTNGEDGNLWLRESMSVGYDNGQATAGVSGNLNDKAFWAGPIGLDDNHLYSVGHDGTLIATSATISGSIRATDISVAKGVFTGEVTIGEVELPVQSTFPLYIGDERNEEGNYPQTGSSYRISKAAINSTITNFPLNELGEAERIYTDYALWAGPYLVENEIIISAEGGNITHKYSTIAPRFAVDLDGRLTANEATISGTVYASSGTFTGEIHATSGNFTGEINATSGFINQLFLKKENGVSYIGAPVGSEILDETTLLSLNDGSLIANANGDLFAKRVFLSYYGDENADRKNKENYSISIGDDSILTVTSTQKQNIFKIDNDGNITMAGNLTGTGLSINGDIELSGNFNAYTSGIAEPTLSIRGESGGIIQGNKNGIGKTGGWFISGDGSAEFENVNVRGKISSVIFETRKTSAVGGSLLVTPSFYVTKDMEQLLPEEIDGKYVYSFELGEQVTSIWKNIKKAKIIQPGVEETNPYEIECSVSEDESTLYIAMDYLAGGFAEGTQVISVDDMISAINLKANDEFGPRIIMNHTDFADEDGKIEKTNRVVIGSLQGSELLGTLFGDGDLGYGLYADNAYLTGKLFLPHAGLTDEDAAEGNIFNYEAWLETKSSLLIDEQANAIRFWAGAAPSERATAPLVITQDGSIYASKGVFKGQIIATNSNFSGTIAASGINLSHDYEGDVDREYQSFKIRWQDDFGHLNPDSQLWENHEFDIAEFNWDGLDLYRGLQFKNPADGSIIFKVLSEYRPRLVAMEYQSWLQKDNQDYSATLAGNHLCFNAVDGLARNDYNTTANALLSTESRVFTIEATKDSTRLESSNAFDVMAGAVEVAHIEKNFTQLHTNTRYCYNRQEKIEVKAVADGIVFNYVGDE